MAVKTEVHFSFDIEADGGYPADFSMLSIGLVACSTFDGRAFKRLDPDAYENQYYATMAPVTKNFDPKAVEVVAAGGVNREELVVSGASPYTIMKEISDFVDRVTGKDRRAVGVCFPSWDIQWLYGYLERYAAVNPFGFSGFIDVKSWYIGKTGSMLVNATKRQMPKKVLSKRMHTHNALDDAIEQAEMWCNMNEML